MIIFKIENISNGKTYIGYAANDNPNNLGTGKYIKRAVKDFGITSFKREVLETFNTDDFLGVIMDRVEFWIKKFKSDNPKYGYNESVQEMIPIKKKLTKKLQVLLTPEDEDNLNTIIKPIPISRYVRNVIVEHIVEETTTEKQLTKTK